MRLACPSVEVHHERRDARSCEAPKSTGLCDSEGIKPAPPRSPGVQWITGREWALAAAQSNFSRRQFLRAGATLGATALLGALPRGWVGSVYADDSPETKTMKFGIIALTDCFPIVIAHEKGLFKKYGINSVVAKGAKWAAIRDSLSTGDNQETHMLIGMPIASTMGLLGSPKKPMIVPWLLNRNGQAICLKAEWKGKVQDDPKALKPFVDKAKQLGEPLTFAMTFPPGTHAM